MANRREQITNILKGLNPLDPKVQDFGEGFKMIMGLVVKTRLRCLSST